MMEFRRNNNQICSQFEKVIADTFDEYEGLRQIKDFRGLGVVGEYIMKEGTFCWLL